MQYFQGRHYRTGQPICLEVGDGGLIELIRPIEARAPLPMIGPAFVDLQVNGEGGQDFNANPMLATAPANISHQLLTYGVTRYCPTLITNKWSAMCKTARQIAKARTEDLVTQLSIIGLHIEGPYISAENGPRGAHPVAHIQPPDWPQFEELRRASRNLVKIVTLAPEHLNIPLFISQATLAGLRVSIGHSNASTDQVELAILNGACGATHLGNGVQAKLARHPNIIQDLMVNDELMISIIADGHHLPANFIRQVLRTASGRVFLVSDSTQFAGMAPGEYETPIGGRVLLASNGRLGMVDSPYLAGSACHLPQCVEFLVQNGLASLPDAWDMASIQPLAFLDGSLPRGLRVGARGDMVSFNYKNSHINIYQVVQAGRVVYQW